MDESSIGFICAGLGIVAFFFIGVGILISGIRNRRKATASNRWPAAGGVITNAWINESRSTDEDGFTSTSYSARVEYQYAVGANTFTSRRISFGSTQSYSNRRKARKELEAYPVNSRVRVYYNPQNPEEAVLIRGTKGTMFGIIMGIIFILLSACFGCAGLFALVENL